MKEKAKAILDDLMAKINNDTATKFVKDRLFSDGIEIPCRNWSLLNQFITFLAGTHDARGIRQWNKAGRTVKKGAKALHIFVPMLYPQKLGVMRSALERWAMPDNCTQTEINGPIIKTLTGFKLMPVFAVEDTEGKPLDYEDRLKSFNVETLPLIDVARKLGVTVQAGLTFDGCSGSFSPDKNKITLGSANRQVFLHELSHAIDNTVPGKSSDYAFNEVVAELSAAFLGSLYGINVDIGSTKAYIKGWAGNGHVAFKVSEALQRVEEIYHFIESNRQKHRKPPGSRSLGNRAAKRPSQPKSSQAASILYEGTLFRTIPVKERSQVYNPRNGKWVKRDEKTGLFCSVKKDGKPYARVPLEENHFSGFDDPKEAG
jgi:hypothetical protein